MLGDVNLDGSVDIIDVVIVRSHIIGWQDISELDDWAFYRADVNKDNSVDIIDAVLLRMKTINKDFEF